MHDLKFPIGEFTFNKEESSAKLMELISNIEQFPQELKEAIQNITIEQVNLKYRAQGWSIKQVIHHCSDSHMNSFIRFKLALTEENAVIRSYFEDKWAELSDSLDNDISDSVLLITAIHSKWTKFLKTLNPEELKIEFIHPEHGTKISLLENIAFYSWHCKHHLAHIKLALSSEVKYR
mgnify:CR=1 FL=1